jgi:hypothetical protein
MGTPSQGPGEVQQPTGLTAHSVSEGFKIFPVEILHAMQ